MVPARLHGNCALRLPPDMPDDIARVVSVYRAFKTPAYALNENRMQQMNERIIKIEGAGLRDAAIAATNDDRTAAKFETITRDLGDVKVTVGRTEEAVRYLVRSPQEERRRAAQ